MGLANFWVNLAFGVFPHFFVLEKNAQTTKYQLVVLETLCLNKLRIFKALFRLVGDFFFDCFGFLGLKQIQEELS